MFQKAQRKKAKLRLALCGPSGSGKTYSSLLLAQGIGGRIAMIDTERGSGELYSEMCEYDVCQLSPPFLPEKYIKAINAAEQAGYTTIIIDSLTHAWAGTGGLLEEVDKKRKGRGNDFTAWRDITPMHNSLVDAMLQSTCHIIGTMRTKTAYEMVKDENTGKIKPIKIGMAPVQRDGLEYEFTTVIDVEVEKHMATSSKDRTGILDGKYFKCSVEIGSQFKTWLDGGIEAPVPASPHQQHATQHQTPPPIIHDIEAVRFEIVTCNSPKELEDFFKSLQLFHGHPQRETIGDLCAKRKADLLASTKTDSAASDHDKLTPPQNKAIQTYYSTCRMDRPAKLKHLSEFFSRPITTTNDLTRDEASRLIEAFKQQEQAA